MLTVAQLRRAAQRNRIGLQAQERDYMQCLFLYLLYTAPRATRAGLYFKGGTALRIVYGSPRFSEDLDFNSELTLDETRTRLRAAAAELSAFGAQALLRNERSNQNGFGCALSYRGPLFNGRPNSKGSVRLDVSTRREPVAVAPVLVTPGYDDIEPFIISTLTLEHILAEKVRALLIRAKPRDLYDLWFLLSKGARADHALINVKMSLYDMTFSATRLKRALRSIQTDWERDLKPLLATVPDFGHAEQLVLDNLA